MTSRFLVLSLVTAFSTLHAEEPQDLQNAKFEDGSHVLRIRGGNDGNVLSARPLIKACDLYVEATFDKGLTKEGLFVVTLEEVTKGECQAKLNPALSHVAKTKLTYKLKKETDACGNSLYKGLSDDPALKQQHSLTILDNRAIVETGGFGHVPVIPECEKAKGIYGARFRDKGIYVQESDSEKGFGIYQRFSPAVIAPLGEETWYAEPVKRSKELALILRETNLATSFFSLQQFTNPPASLPPKPGEFAVSYQTNMVVATGSCWDRREYYGKAEIKNPVRCTLSTRASWFSQGDIRVGDRRPEYRSANVVGEQAETLLAIFKEAGALKQGIKGNYDLIAGFTCFYDGLHYVSPIPETPEVANAYCAAPRLNFPLRAKPFGVTGIKDENGNPVPFTVIPPPKN